MTKYNMIAMITRNTASTARIIKALVIPNGFLGFLGLGGGGSSIIVIGPWSAEGKGI
jgi:hypothetical protein